MKRLTIIGILVGVIAIALMLRDTSAHGKHHNSTCYGSITK